MFGHVPRHILHKVLIAEIQNATITKTNNPTARKPPMTLSIEIISLIISLSAFIASIIFFFAAKESETHAIGLLSQITTQTDNLRTINNSLLQKTIGHIADSNTQLINGLLPLSTTNPLPQGTNDDISKTLSLSSYILKTNFLAIACYNMSGCEKTKSSLLKLTKISQEDYAQIEQLISELDESIIKKSPIFEDYLENKQKFEFLINIKEHHLSQAEQIT